MASHPLRLAIKSVRQVHEPSGDLLGESGMVCDDKQLWLIVGPQTDRSVMAIERLQPAGRNEVSGAEFMRGYRLQRGAQFR